MLIQDRYNCKECTAYTCDNPEHEHEMIENSLNLNKGSQNGR